MPVEQIDSKWAAKRDAWVSLVRSVLDEVGDWCRQANWSVHSETRIVNENSMGSYEVPVLRIRTSKGDELWLTPIGRDIVGAEGRIDLEAWPSLNRVKLIRRGDGWVIMTDSNVPVRERWGRDSFLQLANDLVAGA